MLRTLRHAERLRLALVTLVLAGFALASAMSVSPELHLRLHHDADRDGHECLVTLLDHSGCGDAAPVAVFVVQGPPETDVVLPPTVVEALTPRFLGGSISERGPPVLS